MIIRERTFTGNHTFCIRIILKFSIIVFIISDLLSFVSFLFFGTFFISPSIEINMT